MCTVEPSMVWSSNIRPDTLTTTDNVESNTSQLTNVAQACRHLDNNLNLLYKVEVKACLLIMIKCNIISHNFLLV